MTKHIKDTKAGQSIGAYIILRKNGEHVATVRSHYSDGGICTVNVLNFGTNNPSSQIGPQFAKAGGGGYDKFVAALTGLEIDGNRLSNHCGEQIKPKAGRLFKSTDKKPKGYHFANWTHQKWVNDKPVNLPASEQGYSLCYRESGLKYLSAIGYQVIQAI